MANPRLSVIDDSNRDDHYHLVETDTCLFLYEYTSRRGYAFSATNNLISNLKKKPSQAAQPGYHYKAQAIGECGRALGQALKATWLATATLVPVPGSKAAGHPDRDDRMERVCRQMRNPPPDIRNLVIQTQSTAASHEAEAGERVTVDELLELYAIDETLTEPAPQFLAIVDDVLTAGTHYRAMHTILSERFPGVPILGLFVARRVFPDDPMVADAF